MTARVTGAAELARDFVASCAAKSPATEELRGLYTSADPRTEKAFSRVRRNGIANLADGWDGVRAVGRPQVVACARWRCGGKAFDLRGTDVRMASDGALLSQAYPHPLPIAFVAMDHTGPYDGFLAWPDAYVSADGRVRRCLGLLYVHLVGASDHFAWCVRLPYDGETTLAESLGRIGGWDDGLLISRAVGALQSLGQASEAQE